MGVPAFFRWLSRKYPSVIAECIEQRPTDDSPVDSSLPNPNSVEFDNLYLDMNGIIHPCTHPEDKPAPKNEDEMMVAIFECIDRLFRIVRPRKVLYMAIDGVAPRAKMNQQRSRRFRASKETQEKIVEMARIREELTAKGIWLPPTKEKGEHFDSNCITPGTPFMDRLSKCLHYYIFDRLNNDPGWKGIKVILSDANVPGEGEHKIMDYIRKQRAHEDHDPNTQHVLCGADADLIMLGLATHEPYFTIIREEFKPNKPRPCDLCGQLGHEMKECQGSSPEIASSGGSSTIGVQDSFIFVRLFVLREYLEKELLMPDLPFPYDFERALDDWVFMCFFVGNDFLPHLPSLEIREGAVDRLVTLYKKTVFKTGGWLTDSGDVNLNRVQLILSDLGLAEDQIFKNRQQQELAFKSRERNKRRMTQNQRPNFNLLSKTQFAAMPVSTAVNPIMNPRQEAANIRIAGMHSRSEPLGRGEKRKADTLDNVGNNYQPPKNDNEEDDQAHDEVRLWEDGFKDRYYESKFEVSADQLEFRYKVALQYVRGLCWVLRYYYQGCASWVWYFPYHYAPFASDFLNIGGLSTVFEDGTEPFNPLEQLMGVFPAASKSHVPAPWAELMIDPESPIIDFYPEDFKIDLNGKKFAWQGVALLPFVDEKRLFSALAPFYDKLTREEVKRNTRGNDVLYVGDENPSYAYIKALYTNINKADFMQAVKNKKSFPYSCQGVRGIVMLAENCVEQEGQLNSPICGLPPIRGNTVVCTRFCDPTYPKGYIFPAKRLKGAVAAPRVLKPGNLSHQENRNWKPRIGMGPRTNVASLDQAGHRMLNHHSSGSDSRTYSSIPPPSSLVSGFGGYEHENRNQSSNRGPYRSGYQSYEQQSQPNRSRQYNSGGGGHWAQEHSHNRSSFKTDNRTQNYPGRDNNYQNRSNYGTSGPPQNYNSGQGSRPYQGPQRDNNQGWQRSQPYNRNNNNPNQSNTGRGYGYRP